MKVDYRATEEQWECIEGAAQRYSIASCVLELRARIEALEAAQQQPAPATEESPATAPTAPAGELVERVAKALHDATHPAGNWRPEARAAIREVASWLRSDGPGWPSIASLLEKEANR
jgi:hypothetical protein